MSLLEKKEHLVLFDMDGTLTPTRKSIRWDMVKVLDKLSEHADIGIVTGSGLNYLLDQCKILWSEVGSVETVRVHLLPCNGTQVYRYLDYKWRQTSGVDMREEISRDTYRELISIILGMQEKLTKDAGVTLPFTGNFISYRQSLLNWCPVGRDANDADRNDFKIFDDEHQYRIKAKKKLENVFKKRGIDKIEIALGGQTSLDIFPTGWNKTYALRHYVGKDVWFVGDRCEPGGNDHAIYEHVKKEGKAFQTNNPTNTIKIIEESIIPGLKKK